MEQQLASLGFVLNLEQKTTLRQLIYEDPACFDYFIRNVTSQDILSHVRSILLKITSDITIDSTPKISNPIKTTNVSDTINSLKVISPTGPFISTSFMNLNHLDHLKHIEDLHPTFNSNSVRSFPWKTQDFLTTADSNITTIDTLFSLTNQRQDPHIQNTRTQASLSPQFPFLSQSTSSLKPASTSTSLMSFLTLSPTQTDQASFKPNYETSRPVQPSLGSQQVRPSQPFQMLFSKQDDSQPDSQPTQQWNMSTPITQNILEMDNNNTKNGMNEEQLY